MSSDPLDEAWQRVEDAWEDQEAHKRFRVLAASMDRLAEAGKRYREVRDGAEDDSRRAEAEGHIDALLGLAMQTLETTRAERPEPKGNTKLLFLALGVALTLIGAAAYTMLHGL